MADVLKIALDRRAELQEEVTKLDDFIRMAEMLVRTAKERGEKIEAGATTTPSIAAAAETEAPAMPQRPSQVAENSMRTALRRAEADADADSVARPSVIRRSLTGGPN